jgi:glycerophosphoryl diester phosphodiesterase
VHGAHGAELDVRRSADGALVVHHDGAIEGLGLICELRVAELPAQVALLGEAMTVLEPVVVNVEIKNEPDEPGYDATGSLAHDVVAFLTDLGALDRVVISSFDLPTLDAVHQASGEASTGLLLGYSVDPRKEIDVAVTHGFDALHPWVLTIDPEFVTRAHDAGLDVATWTVNARHDLERMVELGVDTIITDDVALALAVVGADGVQARNGGADASSA